MPLEFSCGAVIFRRTKQKPLYLLLHYAAGHWDFVKGNIERCEKAEETVTREAMEEAGLKDLKFVQGFNEKTSWFYKKEGETIHKEAIWRLTETKTRRIKLSFEHKGYKWLSYEEALQQLTFSESKKLLSKAHNFLKKEG